MPQQRDLAQFVDAATRKLAAAALEKKRNGKKPTIEESRALRRLEKAAEEQKRWEHYGSIPKKHWQELSGRQAKVINDFADRWGAPLRGPTVDLGSFVAWVFDWFSANKHHLAAMLGPGNPSDRYMAAKAAREEIRLELDRQTFISKELIRSMFGTIAASNRRFAQRLEKQFGSAARADYEACLDDQHETIGRYLDRHVHASDDPE
jgi:hypothetical protein